MVCEHRASLRAQTQSSMTTVGSNAASVWQCSSYKPPVSSHRCLSVWPRWSSEELLSLPPGNFPRTMFSSSLWSWWKILFCCRLLFTKDKQLRSPYAWQGHWMWFPMTSTYQKPLTVTGVSCCDFDMSQSHSGFLMEPVFPDGQRWQEDSDDGKVEGEALKRPERGLSPLGKVIMTLLSLSMSIALQSISITSRLPANDRKCW